MMGAPAAGTQAVKVTMLHANFEPKQLCRRVGLGVGGMSMVPDAGRGGADIILHVLSILSSCVMSATRARGIVWHRLTGRYGVFGTPK
jgi:hypothetical protein